MESTAVERFNAWMLCHPEVEYMPSQEEVDAWYEGVPLVAGGQGRDADDATRSMALIAWAGIGLFWLVVGVFIGKVL
ncbi:MAG: hypothetical protein ACE5FA_04130 [Dehalococcoidia bacterium]